MGVAYIHVVVGRLRRKMLRPIDTILCAAMACNWKMQNTMPVIERKRAMGGREKDKEEQLRMTVSGRRRRCQ